MGAKLGEWRWYCGADDHDYEMMDSGTREAAIIDGSREYAHAGRFYIVEARMRLSDEKAMAAGRADTVPFAESRNGEWISASEKSL